MPLVLFLVVERWDDLIGRIGRLGDNSQRQLVHTNSHLHNLYNTLIITNIILVIMASTLILFRILKTAEYRKADT